MRGVQAVVIDGIKHAIVPVPEDQLPIELPDVANYEPTDTGESPLAAISDWVNTTCPKCDGKARRETDTMPNWAGSSWYYLRYMDPNNADALAGEKELAYWSPVDLYNGGMEHTTLHLLYSRFWHKFLFDIKVVPTLEPYARRVSHGMILAEDGQKMSKSRGNVINPDTVVDEYGADTLRMYEMFMGPYEEAKPWSTKGIIGVYRFLEKLWLVVHEWEGSDRPSETSPELAKQFHKTVKKVSQDIENLKFNTAVSAMMILVNQMSKEKQFAQAELEQLLLVLSPFAPHACEEVWSLLGHDDLIAQQPWPEWDESMTQDETVGVAVQVNGKVRTTLQVAADITEDDIVALALADETVQRHTEGKEIKKKIYVPGRIVNIVAP